jgi:hypothetical protein
MLGVWFRAPNVADCILATLVLMSNWRNERAG